MRHLLCPLLAASSLLLVASTGRAATRPRYGGTLRVRIQSPVMSLDPSDGPSPAEAEALMKLRALLYESLVRLDADGRPQSALAVSWEHDERFVRWRFKLRSGVKWHDGSAVAPEEILASLEGLIPGHPARLEGDTLVFDTGDPRPDLLISLATSRAASVRRAQVGSPGGFPIGTGPFRLAEWQSGRRAFFQANEDYWDGRPFLDAIAVEMGSASQERLVDLELDKTDVAELDPSEARRAQQEGRKVWTSAPVELLALQFNSHRPSVSDARLREAIASCIDRAAIQKVLLQNYGEIAGGILPHWLSGYGFLFSTVANLDRAKYLRAEIGSLPTLKIGFDPGDGLARQVAERVAVNARDAGILLQVSPLTQGWSRMADPGVDVMVQRARIEGPAFDAAAQQAAEWFPITIPSGGEPEEVFAEERKYLGAFATVPLVFVPEIFGLGPRVKNWLPTRWGDWHLENVWLEAEKT